MFLSNDNFNFKICYDVRKFYDEFAHNEVCIDTSATGKVLHRGICLEEKTI